MGHSGGRFCVAVVSDRYGLGGAPPWKGGQSTISSNNNKSDEHSFAGHIIDNDFAKDLFSRLNVIASYLGLMAIRRFRHARRSALRAAASARRLATSASRAMLRGIRVLAARNHIPLDRWTQVCSQTVEGSRSASQQGAGRLVVYWLGVVASFIWNVLVRSLLSINYLAPIAAAIIFALVVNTTVDDDFALAVTYNGEFIGYIADESVFEQAEREVLNRIVFEEYIKPEDAIPDFSIAAVSEDELSDVDDITDEIIKASGNELAEATGLYIDGEFMGAVTDSKALGNALSSILDKYRTDEPGESVEFVQDVERRSGLYPLTSIVDMGVLEDVLNSEQSEQRIYTAVAGDAPITIAQKNGISYAQLKALNPTIEQKLLIGQEVLVEKAVPMLEVKQIITETYEEEVNFKIEQIQDDSQYEGYVKVTQVGEKGVNEVTAKVTYVDGVETEREIIDTRIISEPVNEKVVVGGKQPLQQIPQSAMTTSSNFIWPTDGGYVTCLFGSAGYWGHTGMDIGGLPQGSAVRAAASGTVEMVKYNNYGYGYHILINHGGGVQTLYAHNSKIYVEPGEWVEQGQLIAAMGRTGRATGVHVHFEVRVNGQYMNPANYIGTTYPY